MRRRVIATAAGLLATALLILHVAAPSRSNPATNPSLRLDAQAVLPANVAAILRRSCYDCHSNETRWPWYAQVPPTSFLVGRDVAKGRGHMNFSRWGEYNPFGRADMLDSACKFATQGKMPLPQYLLLHADARLGRDDVEALCGWTRSEAARLTSGAPSQ